MSSLFPKSMPKLDEPNIVPDQVVSSLTGQKPLMANGPTSRLKSTALPLSSVEGTQATLTFCNILMGYHYFISPFPVFTAKRLKNGDRTPEEVIFPFR
jgi:hypothetical protein